MYDRSVRNCTISYVSPSTNEYSVQILSVATVCNCALYSGRSFFIKSFCQFPALRHISISKGIRCTYSTSKAATITPRNSRNIFNLSSFTRSSRYIEKTPIAFSQILETASNVHTHIVAARSELSCEAFRFEDLSFSPLLSDLTFIVPSCVTISNSALDPPIRYSRSTTTTTSDNF